MKLIPVALRADHLRHLYRALQERPAAACISHSEMPSRAKHRKHVVDHLPSEATPRGANGLIPYIISAPPRPDAHKGWYLIADDETIIGVIYLSARDEIGIDIFKPYRSKRLARIAIGMLKLRHPRPKYFANVAPGNAASHRLFGRLGKVIQHTYALEAE